MLQRSENHLLAVKVLLSSWHNSASKADLLSASVTALTRKVLRYREIDTALAVACLVMLPYEAMVRELKAAVPSIQSDFSRLRTVASVSAHHRLLTPLPLNTHIPTLTYTQTQRILITYAYNP